MAFQAPAARRRPRARQPSAGLATHSLRPGSGPCRRGTLSPRPEPEAAAARWAQPGRVPCSGCVSVAAAPPARARAPAAARRRPAAPRWSPTAAGGSESARARTLMMILSPGRRPGRRRLGSGARGGGGPDSRVFGPQALQGLLLMTCGSFRSSLRAAASRVTVTTRDSESGRLMPPSAAWPGPPPGPQAAASYKSRSP